MVLRELVRTQLYDLVATRNCVFARKAFAENLSCLVCLENNTTNSLIEEADCTYLHLSQETSDTSKDLNKVHSDTVSGYFTLNTTAIAQSLYVQTEPIKLLSPPNVPISFRTVAGTK